MTKRFSLRRDAALVSKQATVASLAKKARAELEEWAHTPITTWDSGSIVAQFMCIIVWNLRILGFGSSWCTGPGFWRAWARAGGENRINMLITIARFDDDGSGDISEKELADYHKFGEALVASSVGVFQNFSVVLTLLIGATHQTTVGRPKPWDVPLDALQYLSSDAGESLLVTAFGLNSILELMCILTLSACIFLRFILTSTLTTLDSKISFMVESNALANTITMALYCIWMLLILCSIASVLSQPRHGWIFAAAVPFAMICMAKFIARWFHESIKRLHDEACDIIHGVGAEETAGKASKNEDGPDDVAPAITCDI